MASHLFEILGRYTRRTHGRTCLNNALEYAMNTALSSERGGRRGESGVQQEIILVTDGWVIFYDQILVITAFS